MKKSAVIIFLLCLALLCSCSAEKTAAGGALIGGADVSCSHSEFRLLKVCLPKLVLLC